MNILLVFINSCYVEQKSSAIKIQVPRVIDIVSYISESESPVQVKMLSIIETSPL